MRSSEFLYWDSRESRVGSAGVEVQTDKKWRVQKKLEIAQSP